jgi:hypothetical protein
MTPPLLSPSSSLSLPALLLLSLLSLLLVLVMLLLLKPLNQTLKQRHV